MNIQLVTTQKQLEDAYYVRMKVFVEEQLVPAEEEIDQFEDVSTHFILYDEQQRPAGAGRIRILDKIGKVERICVMPAARSKGAGTIIMNALEEYGTKQDIHTFKLNAQIQAIPFYEKLGYRIVSEEFLDAGIPHKTMIKDM